MERKERLGQIKYENKEKTENKAQTGLNVEEGTLSTILKEHLPNQIKKPNHQV